MAMVANWNGVALRSISSPIGMIIAVSLYQGALIAGEG
jgi:hypothetical protein